MCKYSENEDVVARRDVKLPPTYTIYLFVIMKIRGLSVSIDMIVNAGTFFNENCHAYLPFEKLLKSLSPDSLLTDKRAYEQIIDQIQQETREKY